MTKEKGTIGASFGELDDVGENKPVQARDRWILLTRAWRKVVLFLWRDLFCKTLITSATCAVATTCACCGRLLFGTLKVSCLDVCCKCSSPFNCISNLFIDLIKTSSFERAARPVARRQRRRQREFRCFGHFRKLSKTPRCEQTNDTSLSSGLKLVCKI
jgi:hypothetical protein